MEIVVWVYIKQFPGKVKVPYPPEISNELESCYFNAGRKKSTVDIGQIDSSWLGYTVDTNLMKEICSFAGRKHKDVKRMTLPMDSALAKGIFWEFDACSRHQLWEPFDLESMEKLQDADFKGSNKFTLHISRDASYDIDLTMKTQTRIQTKSKRSIRRTQLTEEYIQKRPSATQAQSQSRWQQLESTVMNFLGGALSTGSASPPLPNRSGATASGGRSKEGKDSDRSPSGSRLSGLSRQNTKSNYQKGAKIERLPKEKKFTNSQKTKAQSMESVLRKYVVHVDVSSRHQSSDESDTEDSDSDLESEEDDQQLGAIGGATSSYSLTKNQHRMVPGRSSVYDEYEENWRDDEDERWKKENIKKREKVGGRFAEGNDHRKKFNGNSGEVYNSKKYQSTEDERWENQHCRERKDRAGNRYLVKEKQNGKSKGKTDEKYNKQEEESKTDEEEDENCCICMDLLTQASPYGEDEESDDAFTVVELKCKHRFHYLCLLKMCSSQTKDLSIQCPWCKQIYGEKTGICPPGMMTWLILPNVHLAGYEDHDTICITYDISSGTQGPEHPEPGKPFRVQGFPRTGYIPNSNQGKKVLKLLITAWRRRLTFTVGQSVTTGNSGVVTWNEIHHKTEANGNKSGHGYPDDGYLDNVEMELAAHGVTEPDKDL